MEFHLQRWSTLNFLQSTTKLQSEFTFHCLLLCDTAQCWNRTGLLILPQPCAHVYSARSHQCIAPGLFFHTRNRSALHSFFFGGHKFSAAERIWPTGTFWPQNYLQKATPPLKRRNIELWRISTQRFFMFDDHLWKYKVVLHYFRTWELKGLFLNWWKILQEHCKFKTALTSRYKLKISFPFARNCGCFPFQPISLHN